MADFYGCKCFVPYVYRVLYLVSVGIRSVFRGLVGLLAYMPLVTWEDAGKGGAFLKRYITVYHKLLCIHTCTIMRRSSIFHRSSPIIVIDLFPICLHLS